MLVRTYHIIQAILIWCLRGILLTTVTEDNLLHKAVILHIQRKGNHEFQIQALNTIVAGLQIQVNNLSSGGSGGEDPNIGTM